MLFVKNGKNQLEKICFTVDLEQGGADKVCILLVAAANCENKQEFNYSPKIKGLQSQRAYLEYLISKYWGAKFPLNDE